MPVLAAKSAKTVSASFYDARIRLKIKFNLPTLSVRFLAKLPR